MATSRAPIIGIDLGTTNSVVGVVQSGHPIIIPSRAGAHLTPSVVAISRDGRRLVGALAKRQAVTNPEGTIYAAKRLIGRRFSSPEVQRCVGQLGYAIQAGAHDDLRIPFGGVDASVPELSALVLASLKTDAEAFLERTVHEAVITVPAHFSDAQRQATKDAGRIAGLDVLRIINEPTAAALAYGLSRRPQGRVLVFDLGGGTFDVTLLEMHAGVYEVLATGGDTFLGGEDFDRRIIGWLFEQIEAQLGVDLRGDLMATQRLRDAAERAKIELSSAQQAEVNLPFLYAPRGANSAVHFQCILTRERLESLTQDLIDRTLAVVDGVLSDAKLRAMQLHDVLLVGGQTRMPKLQDRVQRHLGREPSKGVHPDEVVALGAAIHAHSLGFGGEDVTLLDVTSMSLGVAIAGGFTRRLIQRNTTVPTATTESFTTSRDGQTTVRIVVLQGEAEQAEQNELLGSFSLSELRPALRGEVQVDVTFEIDTEGIVSVSAVDRETGARQQITVAASGGLTPEELEAIVRREQDLMSPARGEGTLESRREELGRAMEEAHALLAQVRSLTGRVSTSGSLGRAEALIEAARGSYEGGASLAEVVGSLEEVQRLARSLRSMLHAGAS